MGTGGNPSLQDTVCIPAHPTESPKTLLYDTGRGRGSSAGSGESNDAYRDVMWNSARISCYLLLVCCDATPTGV